MANETEPNNYVTFMEPHFFLNLKEEETSLKTGLK